MHFSELGDEFVIAIMKKQSTCILPLTRFCRD